MKNFIFLFLLISIFKAEAQSSSALTVSKKADSLFEIGEYNKAIPYFLENDRFYEAAKSYEALGNNMDAQELYVKALSKNSRSPKTEFEYAKLLVKISNYKRADSLLQNLHSRFPNNPNIVYERGLIKEFQNDSTAFDFFRQVHKMDRNYIENRKFEEAVPFIDEGLAANKNSSRFLTLRALKEYHSQEFHDAITTFNLLISKGDSYISLHENLAKAYAQTF